MASAKDKPFTRSAASKLEAVSDILLTEHSSDDKAMGKIPCDEGATATHTNEPSSVARLTALEDQMLHITTALSDISGFIQNLQAETKASQTSHGLQVPLEPQSMDMSNSERRGRDQCTSETGRLNGRHFAKPQEYDGSVPWLSYKTQFEAIAAVHGWADSDRVGELVACLKGPALEVFAHLPASDQLQYSRLVDALHQRFGQTNQQLWFRSQFRRRVRNPGESLPALAQDLERLAALAYPVADQSLRDSLACEQFLDGLSDVELQIAVRQSRPGKLQEAVTSAVEIEAIRKSAEASATVSSGFTTRQVHAGKSHTRSEVPNKEAQSSEQLLEAILQRIQQLEASVSSAKQENPGRQQRSWGNVARVGSEGCWQCGQKGHIRRNCPQRQTRGSYQKDQNQGN